VGGAEPMLIVQDETNADGRTDRPILPEEDFVPGTYELIFHVGSYFATQGLAGGFLGEVPVRFTMSEGHYHVPLLASPFGYSTYRGS
jgi:5-hydroxyisourate hydrolase